MKTFTVVSRVKFLCVTFYQLLDVSQFHRISVAATLPATQSDSKMLEDLRDYTSVLLSQDFSLTYLLI